MKLPQKIQTRAAIALGVAATSAIMVVGPGSAAAMAGHLITSADIQDHTIRGVDIHRATITWRQIKPGSLRASDFSGSLRGATGRTGPRGPAGPAGGGAAARIVDWHVHYGGGPTYNQAVVTSTDTVPAGTQVEVVRLTAPSGDWSSCGMANINVTATGLGGVNQASASFNGTWHLPPTVGGGAIMNQAGGLTFVAYCNGNPSVPAFDATVTLALTKRDTTPTGTFH